ncbi:MAG: type II toxin-antitoxin system ParD family antitoxin [Oxalobacteraceae bacterium]|uniref:ribbon-helix-helix domain-containing protein n=1 Tax=Rhizobium sp. CFBP 8752 TaxID=2775301 RepID=UPI0010F12332|nr:type II toxin-antitoxin system ParD family antitoxin [Rhizobium sp. CFBP 8752]MBD8662058.1 type II toxin-antitoxin system ParD family antitoxin [Rhizobium sp. CFBP 8752]RYE61413.1 MAG: type II toxin-antitoxin system ParD family antitoxin [Oxalobacteraceae bacterium]
MPPCNVVLTEHHQQVIERLLETGRYQNAGEIVGDALRLIEQREALDGAKLALLQSAAATGFDDLETGRFAGVPVTGLEQFIAGLGDTPSQR